LEYARTFIKTQTYNGPLKTWTAIVWKLSSYQNDIAERCSDIHRPDYDQIWQT